MKNKLINKLINTIEENKQTEKTKCFLSTLGETGKIADKVSDLILFHNRVRKNAEARLWNGGNI